MQIMVGLSLTLLFVLQNLICKEKKILKKKQKFGLKGRIYEPS